MRSQGAPQRHVTPKIKLIRLAQQTCRSDASTCPKQGKLGKLGSVRHGLLLLPQQLTSASAMRVQSIGKRLRRWPPIELPKHVRVETSNQPLKLGDFAVGEDL